MQSISYNKDSIYSSFNKIDQEKQDVFAQMTKIDHILQLCDQLNDPEMGFAEDLEQDLNVIATTVFSLFGVWETPQPIAQPEREIHYKENFNNLIAHGDKIEALHLEIQKTLSAYQMCQDDEVKQTLCLQILELEKSFEEARVNFTAAKCSLLTPLKKELQPFEGEEGVAELSTDIELELQNGCNVALVQERLEEVNENIRAFKTEIAQNYREILKELTQKYLGKLELFEKELLEQNKIFSQSIEKFMQLPFNAEDKVALEKESQEAQLLFSKYSEKLQKMRELLSDPANAASKSILEDNCTLLNLKLHTIRQNFLKKLADVSTLKHFMLRDSVHLKALEIVPEELEKHLTALYQDTAEIAFRLKQASKELKILVEQNSEGKSSSFFDPLFSNPMSKFKPVESWSATPWGMILINQDNGPCLRDQLGIGFKSTIDQLQETRINLKIQIEALLDSDDAEKLDNLKQQLNQVDRLYYHTILTRIIEMVGEKQRILKKHADELTPQQTKLMQIEIQLLDAKFESCLRKYELIPMSSQSLLSAAKNYTFDLFKTIASLGYVNDTFLTAEVLRREKHYANLGYNMVEDVQAWMKSLQVKENETIQGVLKREVEDFIKWADADPATAMALARDMALTCAIIGGQSYMDQFIGTMRVKAYSYAFRDGWKPFPTDELAPTEEALKYYSLSQLFRCAPVLTAVLKSLASSDYSNPVGVFLKTGIEALKSHAIRQAGDFIPDEHANLALQVLNIMRGESFQRILEEQRNIELARVGGTVTQLFSSPSDFLKRVQLETKLWVQTLRHSSGQEKILRIASQILLPTASVVLSAGAAAAVILGGPISWITVLTFSFASLSVSLTAARKADQLFNSIYPTRQKVLDEMKAQIKQDAKIAIRNEVIQQREAFIQEMVKYKILPKIEPSSLELSADQEQALNKAKELALKDLLEEMNKQLKLIRKPTAIECVKIYNEYGLKKLPIIVREIAQQPEYREFINSNEVQKKMANELAEFLMNNWLNDQIDEVFSERAIELSLGGKSKLKSVQDPKYLIKNELERLVPDVDKRKEIESQLDRSL